VLTVGAQQGMIQVGKERGAHMRRFVLAGFALTLFAGGAGAAERHHVLPSPYQEKETELRVLLPDRMRADTAYPAVYILPLLPIGSPKSARYGDGFDEVRRHDLHNKYDAIFISPDMHTHPWYADHPSLKDQRQESHVVGVVVPFVDAAYPVLTKPEGRYLIGMSASGWGAANLILRHPGVFGKAAIWDAPLMLAEPRWNILRQLGNRAAFDLHRFDRLVSAAKAKPQQIILVGCFQFCDFHKQAEAVMQREAIPHTVGVTTPRPHLWTSDWLPAAAEALFGARVASR
jgi:hypothetical protein